MCQKYPSYLIFRPLLGGAPSLANFQIWAIHSAWKLVKVKPGAVERSFLIHRTYLSPHTHNIFTQSRTLYTILSFTFPLEKVHLLYKLEAEATPDTHTCYLHDAELKQGFRVGPEKHYNFPTIVLDESQQLPDWSALCRVA